MSKKEQELALKQEQELALQNEMMNEWGQEEVSSNDLVIPKLWLMQALSEMVAEKELAKAGDIVDSLTETVIGGTATAVKLVPFKVEKLWYTIKENGDKGELVSIEPVTKENEGQDREFTADGEKYRRMYTYKFFFVTEDSPLPVIATFKSTSLRAGKQMYTEMYIKNKMAGKSPAARFMLLSSEKRKNDKGVFYVFKVDTGEDVPMELQKKALDWYKTLNVKDYKEASDDATPTTDSDNSAQF